MLPLCCPDQGLPRHRQGKTRAASSACLLPTPVVLALPSWLALSSPFFRFTFAASANEAILTWRPSACRAPSGARPSFLSLITWNGGIDLRSPHHTRTHTHTDRSEFGTTEKDLESLRFMTRPNPMNPKGPPMRLFLKYASHCARARGGEVPSTGWFELTQHRKEVRRVMLKKYGGEEKLNKVIETRLAKEKEKPSNSLFTAKSANPSVIKFSSQRGATYGCFSTFSPHPVTLKGKEWPTAVCSLISLSLSLLAVSCRVPNPSPFPSQEHYFQAQKFAGMPLEELIRKAADPLRAKKMGEDKDIPPRSDWKDKQEEVMYTRPSPHPSAAVFCLSLCMCPHRWSSRRYEATLAKFTDHKDIQETLLSTGFADIFYHTRSGNTHTHTRTHNTQLNADEPATCRLLLGRCRRWERGEQAGQDSVPGARQAAARGRGHHQAEAEQQFGQKRTKRKERKAKETKVGQRGRGGRGGRRRWQRIREQVAGEGQEEGGPQARRMGHQRHSVSVNKRPRSDAERQRYFSITTRVLGWTSAETVKYTHALECNQEKSEEERARAEWMGLRQPDIPAVSGSDDHSSEEGDSTYSSSTGDSSSRADSSARWTEVQPDRRSWGRHQSCSILPLPVFGLYLQRG